MKRKFAMLVSIALTVAMLYAIWQFSAQNSSETSALSGKLAWKVTSVAEKVLGRDLNVLKVEALLRKMAHFGVFMALGFGLAGIFVWQRKIPVPVIVIMLGMICAVLDEFHQSFTPGRNPSGFDVMIDTAGVCVGMIVVLLVRRLLRKSMKGKEDYYEEIDGEG